MQDNSNPRVKVIIPWKHHESRVPGLEWIKEWYSSLFGEDNIHISECSEPLFNKSKAVNAMAKKLEDESDILIIGDADCVICNAAIKAGIKDAYTYQKLIIPHTSHCYTNSRQAKYLLSRNPKRGAYGRWFLHKRGASAPAGIWIIPTSVYLANPMNELFRGWGGEDTEFIARTPHLRIGGPLFHINHTKASRKHSKRNYRIRKHLLKDNRIYVPSIDFHIIDACNLSCEYCNHYSNFKQPANLLVPDKETIDKVWGNWNTKIKPGRLIILGGEPTLNPHLEEWMIQAGNYWKHSTIWLITNGHKLEKFTELPDILRKYNVTLAMSLHESDEKNLANREKLRPFCDKGINTKIYNSRRTGWRKFYDISSDGKVIPFNDNNQRASWLTCCSKKCHTLRDGKIWKCPQVAHASNVGVTWFEGYNPLEPDCTREQIIEWVSREDEPCCRNCPSAPVEAKDREGLHLIKPRVIT